MTIRETIPSASLIHIESNEYDYVDSYFHPLVRTDVESWELIPAFFLSAPKWVDGLMVIRNKIVSLVGLKTGSPENNLLNPPFSKEQQVGVFRILEMSDKEIVLGDTDKHLDFKVSLLIHDSGISASTIVRINNTLGRWYFFVVKPIHRIIVPIVVRRMIKNIDEKLLPQYAINRT